MKRLSNLNPERNTHKYTIDSDPYRVRVSTPTVYRGSLDSKLSNEGGVSLS